MVIVQELQNFKDLKLRSCPKIARDRNRATKYLYCGSIKNGIAGRLIQHLGYGSQNTYSLQLCHWANKIGLILEFHYSFIKKGESGLTELVESALAHTVKPLVGKIEGKISEKS